MVEDVPQVRGRKPLEIEEKDRAILISRVKRAYHKTVICMRYYPEIWCVPPILFIIHLLIDAGSWRTPEPFPSGRTTMHYLSSRPASTPIQKGTSFI
jgi:hypothetical protein